MAAHVSVREVLLLPQLGSTSGYAVADLEGDEKPAHPHDFSNTRKNCLNLNKKIYFNYFNNLSYWTKILKSVLHLQSFTLDPPLG